jgi:hypothetical protein
LKGCASGKNNHELEKYTKGALKKFANRALSGTLQLLLKARLKCGFILDTAQEANRAGIRSQRISKKSVRKIAAISALAGFY